MARELGAMGEREARLVMNEIHPSAHCLCACYRAGHRPTRRVPSDNSRSSTLSLAPCRFTDKWKAQLRHPSVPPKALPPALKRAFDIANTNKERHRRASSFLIRSPSLAMADGDAEGRSARASASAKVVPK